MGFMERITEQFTYAWNEKKYNSTVAELQELYSLYHGAVGKEAYSEATKAYTEAHRKFVSNCLAPYSFQRGKKTVLVKYIHIGSLYDDGSGKDIVTLAVLTPQMLLTDYYFYSRNAYWGENTSKSHPEDYFYKPFYYELDVYPDKDTGCYEKLKSSMSKGEWFSAELYKEDVQDAGAHSNVPGKLCFSASKYEIHDVYMNLMGQVSDVELLKLLKVVDHKPDEKKFDKNVAPFLSTISGTIQPGSEAVVYNVGQANCVYLYLQLSGIGQKRVFFDVGRPFDQIEVIKNYYTDNPDLAAGTEVSNNLICITGCKPDAILISHWHSDHIQAALTLGKYVYEETSSCQWIAPVPNDDDVLNRYRRLINFLMIRSKIKFVDYNYPAGVVLKNGDIELYQGQGNKNEVNASSLMLKVKDTLFAADCMYSYWPANLQAALPDIKQMVAPHHGMKLDATDLAVTGTAYGQDKKEAVVCVGENQFYHPNKYHLNELSQMKFKKVTDFQTSKSTSRIYLNLL